ncbi:unnamed protein product [Somion occarium]|uniref:Uncharacterized protein n=1 Tax=Somion occarium TaxID=3059160 RepID=A0ABP1CGI0_9APHY
MQRQFYSSNFIAGVPAGPVPVFLSMRYRSAKRLVEIHQLQWMYIVIYTQHNSAEYTPASTRSQGYLVLANHTSHREAVEVIQMWLILDHFWTRYYQITTKPYYTRTNTAKTLGSTMNSTTTSLCQRYRSSMSAHSELTGFSIRFKNCHK